MTATRSALAPLLAATALLTACSKEAEAPPLLSAIAPPGWDDTTADFTNAAGDKVGAVAFKEGAGGVLLRVDVQGLSEGWHGIHLHQVGTCEDMAEGFKASGAHVDPDDHEHGLLNPEGSERADLPNLYAGADGRATAEMFRWGVTLSPSGEADANAYALFDADGFAVIIHENADDQTTQPIGGAAGRVACAALTR